MDNKWTTSASVALNTCFKHGRVNVKSAGYAIAAYDATILRMDPKLLLVVALALPLCAQVKITQQGKEKISVEIDGKPFTDFYIGPETVKPYLHPLRTADGKVVTRGFPMVTDIPGEAHDHPHPAAWGSTTAAATATASG